MKLSEEARLISFRGLYLLTTGTKALAVNKTFAEIWDFASSGSFTQESLTEELSERFGLNHEEASAEVQQILDNWENNGLLICS